MPTAPAATNPAASGGGGGATPTDEVTSHADVAPAALVSPQTYNLTGVRVVLGKPRVVCESFVKDLKTYYWFPEVDNFGKSGKMLVTALLSGDNSQNSTDVVERNLSTDGGNAFTNIGDEVGFSPNGLYDPGTGRIYFFGNRGKPIGSSVRNFTMDRGYHAWTTDGKIKTVSFPHGAAFTGLPWDIEPWVPTLDAATNNYTPRRVWSWFFADCRPIICNGGEWMLSAYVYRQGESLSTPVIFTSTDQGKNWTYLSVPSGALNSGDSEATLIQLADGRIFWGARWDAGTPIWRYAVSSDAGASWSTPQSTIINLGQVNPNAVQLDNGIVVTVTGWQGWTLCLGLCIDGIPGGVGVWQGKELLTHHNLYDEAPGTMDANKIRAFTVPYDDHTTAYLSLFVTGTNRVLIVYDKIIGRSPVRSGTAANVGPPNQIFAVEAEITRL